MWGTLPAASAFEVLGWKRARSRQHDASQVLSGKWLCLRETDANRVTGALISMMHRS